jgi:hypothetical protein
MVNEILTASGVQFRRSRFPKPPAETYAVYMDDITATGPDHMPARIFTHDITVELYEPEPDDVAEAAIEAAITAQGIPWTKEDRYWLQDVQRYQVIYEFSYTVKT